MNISLEEHDNSDNTDQSLKFSALHVTFPIGQKLVGYVVVKNYDEKFNVS